MWESRSGSDTGGYSERPMRRAILLISLLVFAPPIVHAQISPGELSRAHQNLEGVTNCSQCHESGAEITGNKCLTCHAEIRKQIEARRGYHFAISASSCVTCHKEHLGRDSKITRFDPSSFDHSKSGFALAGKHALLRCEQCHTEKNIGSQEVRKSLAAFPHTTYIGLEQRCISCHADRHRNTVSTQCQTCHTVNSWTPATGFDHAKSKFALAGKHATVECIKCHEGARKKGPADPVLFTAKSFADCTPCHASPHGPKFADKTCRSCHAPESWSSVRSFNHAVTKFSLSGKHAGVPCVKCHTQMDSKKGAAVNFATKDFRDCQPCHNSPHGPKVSAQQCKTCHESSSWAARNQLAFDHELTRFSLEGKHKTLKCVACHKSTTTAKFADRYLIPFSRCTDCHSDYHEGQFAEKFRNDCSACHGLNGFRPSTFTLQRHSGSAFPLTGSHAAVPCATCHTGGNEIAKSNVKYTGLPVECESCHKDFHRGQFARGGKTTCALCHSPVNWRTLVFNHDIQSSFPLTGAHRGVPCRSCHKEDFSLGEKFVRYKPLSTRCESCHQGEK